MPTELNEVLSLSTRLRDEYLFVSSEQANLKKLYSEINRSTEDLYHESWRSWQLKLIGDSLLSRSNINDLNVWKRFAYVEDCSALDAYKILQNKERAFSEVITKMR